MRRIFLVSALVMTLGLASCAQMGNYASSDQLQQAARAMGADKVKSIAFTSSGTGATFGQAYLPDSPWPKINYSNMARHYDYASFAMGEDAARSRAEPQGGGAVPLIGLGEQKTSARLNGDFAWNLTPNAAAAPVAVAQRQHDLWTSPHGVLNAAMAAKFQAKVTLDAQGMVARVDSVMPNVVLGDVAVTTWYENYKDYGGVQFPSRIRQTAAGHPVLDVMVSDVKVGTPLDAAVPDTVRNFKENVVATKAAETNGLGIWFMAGGSHNSVLIEMTDHAIMVEAPLYEGRTNAAIAKAKELLPSKPLRYVVNSHHHFDHAGGLRAASKHGVTLVTSEAARAYFAKALQYDKVEGVSGMKSYDDAKRRVEVREIAGSIHVQGFMMVYLPTEKILIEADAYTPGAPNAPTPAKINDNHLNLASNIQTQGLQVDRILPLHGRMVDISELNRAIGK